MPHGDQRTIRLDDGSIIHLNSQSRVHVRYSSGERLIELEQGQALFDVVRDATRPFRVRAGSADILAVGTQFDVYRRSGGDLTVTVVEGKVAVTDRGMKQPQPAGASEKIRPSIRQPDGRRADPSGVRHGSTRRRGSRYQQRDGLGEAGNHLQGTPTG